VRIFARTLFHFILSAALSTLDVTNRLLNLRLVLSAEKLPLEAGLG
jgi:hypothetical protein